jgi:CBS domain-containing protein
MFDRPVRSVIRRRNILKAPPETTVRRAATLMAKKNVGAVMVVVDGRLAGIFTERDVVFRVVARGLDPAATRIADVMTRRPRTVGPDATFGRALLLMHDHGFRHLPVVEDGVPIGIVSARSAMDPELEEFIAEAQRRERFRAED